MEYFEILPLEITSDILCRLPTQSVLDCKLVCRKWRSLISQFSKLQLHRLSNTDSDYGKSGFLTLTRSMTGNEFLYYFKYDDNHEPTTAPIQKIQRFNFTIPFSNCWFVASCNGLICFAGFHPFVYICNPITKESLVLPEIKADSGVEYKYWSFGFGCVPSTNEYKVVKICRMTGFVEVHVYTLGSGNGWRNLGKFNSKFGTHPWEECVFANGALYWINSKVEMIVTFGLAEEKFCEHISPPALPQDGEWHNNMIGVFDGVLFYADWLKVEAADGYDIWLLKMNNHNNGTGQDVHQSFGWSKEFQVDDSILSSVTKKGGVLTYSDDCLYIYDTKASTSKRLVDFKERIDELHPHRNTLVSLKGLGEEDTQIMVSVEVEDAKGHDQPSVIGG